MKRLGTLLLFLAATTGARPAPSALARWQREARAVTIIRDDWGIPHIYGKTDADAVFGMIYAQAEDDFNRVETNYINAMGRLAEAEGESAIYQDLRMKLFINPDSLRAQYARSPAWLKALMNAWADGLNFFLYKHPDVKPRVITHFEPWMALSFTEGSIGVDVLDEYLETVVKNGNRYFYRYGSADRAMTVATITVPHKTASGMARKTFTVYRIHHGPIVRHLGDRWVSIRLMQDPIHALM